MLEQRVIHMQRMRETHLEIAIDDEQCLIIRNQAVPLTKEELAGGCEYCQMKGCMRATWGKEQQMARRWG